MDYLARKKAANHMTFTVMDSLPLPRRYTASLLEWEIAVRSLRLCSAGTEMQTFWTDTAVLFGLDPLRESPSDEPDERDRLRAELDVLVARDLFELTLDEMRYVFVPSDILGADCAFETFGALGRAEQRKYGEFRSRRLILDTWETLPSPVVPIQPASAAT
jgi:hypothetical protein